MKPGTWSTAYRSNRPSHCDDLRLPAGDTLRSVWHAGNRCHFVLLDKDESCPTVDLSNTGRPSGPDYSTGDGGELLNRPPILAQNRDFYLPHLHSTPPLGGGGPVRIAIPFGTEKLEWCGYPMLKKCRRYLYSFLQNVRTWHLTHTPTQTDTHTPHDGIGRACIASRGKNQNNQLSSSFTNVSRRQPVRCWLWSPMFVCLALLRCLFVT